MPSRPFPSPLGSLSPFPRRLGLALLDARQSLASATWVNEGNGVFSTQINLADPHTPGGTGSNTTYFGVWHGSEFLDWIVGGADIAANLSTLAAEEAGFAVNVSGSTEQDIRSDASTTGPFDLFVKLPGGGDPTGQALFCSDKASHGFFNGQTVRKARMIGAFSKDSLGVSDYGDPATFVDCEVIGAGGHAWVGPALLTRHAAIGEPRSGMFDAAHGRASGAAVNFYSPQFNSDMGLTIDGLTAKNFAKAVYAHGSGNQCYRKVFVSGLVTIDNCRSGFDEDAVGAGLLPVYSAGILSDAELRVTAIDNMFKCAGVWEFLGGGRIDTTANPVTNTTNLVTFAGANSHLTLKDTVIAGGAANSLSYKNQLCVRSTGSVFNAPTLVLDNVRDESDNDKRFLWVRWPSDVTVEQSHLVLKGGTVLKDLADQAGRTNFPASITVEAGCTFGFGNRTGPELEAALTAAGVPHYISRDTTIVGVDGLVLSAPGWSH
ncbi:hypothetical protein TRP8649_01415 [Pelagimonas phthalicica]|uniref:Uncharacterized protein n=1 Tax=Pelagimonas phthalicica TaxID=1037362 RepID=A0A238JBH8_9RHOB|nr:hypothetical protein [Pelagimonas phthalicica]TDS94163.1 hypothetical protein CLV87_0657 [Pelagimonas phthalicica]SMX27312.1 hypothetical protein TRP8649_01415 [Pelagimonas phthalicica]